MRPDERYEDGQDAQGPSHQFARARLAFALQEAAADWRLAWAVRVRRGFAVSRLRLAAAATMVLAVTAMLAWQSRAASRLRSDRTAEPRFAALPIASLTPGTVSVASAAALCAGSRPSRLVSDDVRRQVLRSYRMERVPADQYELDALITPELGGSTDAGNLWPQRYTSTVWNARVKDDLERLLPRLVCGGTVDLAQAQRDIATDWIAAYKKYFRTSTPLQAQASIDTDDDLEFAPPRRAADALALMSIMLVTSR